MTIIYERGGEKVIQPTRCCKCDGDVEIGEHAKELQPPCPFCRRKIRAKAEADRRRRNATA